MKRKMVVSILALGLVAALIAASPAQAKKPVANSSGATISLVTQNPKLGDWVTFSYSGLPNGANSPRIQLVCYQNGAMVYGADQAANTAFLLGAYGSTWLSNGGAASCHASLYQNGGSGYQFFASTDFATQ